ncbi:MAG: 30S ribosomal protein S18 [Victivallales bacterium]|nr:30S ribosomal protein S18 [Victivallales bacterium]
MQNNRRKRKKRERRIKICRFCESRTNYIDFLDTELLKKFQTENGKILPRRVTGTCLIHQKLLGKAIKKARVLSLVR